MALNYHLMFKILLVGDPEVGKAAILHQSGRESSCPSTVGVNFLKRKLELGKCCIHLWSVLFNLTQFINLPRPFSFVYILPKSFILIFQTVGKA